MNEKLSVGEEEASDDDEDSESDSSVLHQYEDVYKLRCQYSSICSILSKSCPQRDGGGEKGPSRRRGRSEQLLLCSDISQSDGSVTCHYSHPHIVVLEFLSEERRKVYFPTMRKCKTCKLFNI